MKKSFKKALKSWIKTNLIGEQPHLYIVKGQKMITTAALVVILVLLVALFAYVHNMQMNLINHDFRMDQSCSEILTILENKKCFFEEHESYKPESKEDRNINIEDLKKMSTFVDVTFES